jgi:hypothetical protein
MMSVGVDLFDRFIACQCLIDFKFEIMAKLVDLVIIMWWVTFTLPGLAGVGTASEAKAQGIPRLEN